jgi:translation elongation factor EF-Ts
MERLEKVEKLRSKANVSYEEAKEALDACIDDILDAMVYLEKNGKVKKPNTDVYTTNYEDDNK